MKHIANNYLRVLVVLLLLAPSMVYSQIRLSKVIGNNMVLQQGTKVNIWGDAQPNESITVKFQKQTKKTKADADGKWAVILDELGATKIPQRLIISGKKDRIVLQNILIGEVWLASGQSNMEYSMNNHPQFAKPERGAKNYLNDEYKAADSPVIRVLYVEKNIKTDTLPSKGWQMINEETLAPISAIGYFFAKSLLKNLDVPVGIISSSWGGTPIETWTPEAAYLSSTTFQNKINDNKLNGVTIGERYKKMIEPLAPYSLKGILWYQGETNVINGDGYNYAEKMKIFVESWRSAWNNEIMPFYYVQLAPYIYSQRRDDLIAKTWESLPIFWEAQTSCMNIPYTGMVVTTDLVDNPKDIHPSYKWIVADRLARWALAKSYGKKDILYSGPSFKSLSMNNDKIILEFDNVGSGLVTSDGKAPDWFYIKKKNGRFAKTKATIHDNKIVITADDIYEPMSIRFAWDEVAMPNLQNKEGLPALPFVFDGENK